MVIRVCTINYTHHITQRAKNGAVVCFDNEDRRFYLKLQEESLYFHYSIYIDPEKTLYDPKIAVAGIMMPMNKYASLSPPMRSYIL